MDYLKEHRSQVGGVTLHTVKTTKFKTNAITLKFKAPLKEETSTLRALLPHVLQRGTKSHPNSMSLRKYLDDLYGAALNVDLAKKGEEHIISIRLDIPNEKFLSDKTPLLSKGIELLAEFVEKREHPFDEAVVEQEKANLKQRITAVYDDKMRYANLRLVQEMCEGEPYALHVNGELDRVDQIQSEQLFSYYNKVISEDKIDLFVVGDIDEYTVNETVDRSFHLKTTPKEREVKQTATNIVEVNEVVEEQDVSQGKLNIGFRTNVSYGSDQYFALQLFNGIFGGFSHSKLFRNVREKESLAYYAASRVESHKGLLMVMSGIDVGNFNKAVTIIKEQFKEMQAGNFSDEEISQTKAVIKNQLLETIDTSFGMVELLYHNVIAGTDRSFQQLIEGIDRVDKNDIEKVASQIQLDTIYFLKGGGNAR
ncbi:pitrilysin family protein [Bacillus carboniphilus]|uniref:Pitrilysin family protein n=1 Tax=Bacillus carboniphilus TaxID=86663 RepID=A0ABY9JYG3_9BACI|nr:pitrilysin family protein [Bacillus carboniphilus]WLR43485.1 pitrilysin family protein [Bacillus carboniphilus]